MDKLKKMLPLMALTLVAATSVVSAVDDMQVRNLENRVSALEQRRGANGMINPPARPVVKDGTDLWIQADVLYMHATEDGVNYGIRQETNSSFIDGQVKNISYDWNWGWRAGIGYNLPHDGWDMLLNYTWFRSNESKTSNTDAPESIRQTWTNPYNTQGAADALVAHALGRTHLKFDYLDFQLGREFFVSKWLTLRPFMGARGLWAHRDMTIKYSGGSALGALQTPLSKLKEKFSNRFRGGGLLAGLDTQWGLGEGWSFYGQFALSLIYGTQRLHEKQDEYTAAAAVTRIAHVHDSWTIVRTMTDLGLGLRWDHLFYDDAYRIRFQLGWEQHILNGFDKDINLVNSTVQGKFAFNQGDFALSGITFQARFDF
ncbi:MAG: Lpg1974 family pore-forming outer membrane protein [Rhabdochlamydiaceae bacterium]